MKQSVHVALTLIVCLVLSPLGTPAVVSPVRAASLGTWTRLSLMTKGVEYEHQVGCLAIDPASPSTLYAGGSGIFRSTDSGATWSQVGKGLPAWGIRCLAVDPVAPSTLYAGTAMDGAFRSTNSGASWVPVNNGLTTTYIQCIVIDPITTTTIYAGTNNGDVFRSSNGGNEWSSSNVGLPDFGGVTVLAIDPKVPTTLYVSMFGSSLFRSTNGATSWMPAKTGLASPYVQCLAIDPDIPGTLFAGTVNRGVFRSTDSGATWAAVNTGLPNQTTVTSLAIDSTPPATLYAGTSGHGVYCSTNDGGDWTSLNTYLDGCPSTLDEIIYLAIGSTKRNTVLYAGTQGTGSIHRYDAPRTTSQKTTVAVLQVGASKFTVNGLARTLDSPPIIRNGRTLVPIRAVIEALGGTVAWDGATRKASVTLGSTTIELWIGKSGTRINGASALIDPTNARVVPEIINGRTMLPLRFVSESLGCLVVWADATKTITITYLP